MFGQAWRRFRLHDARSPSVAFCCLNRLDRIRRRAPRIRTGLRTRMNTAPKPCRHPGCAALVANARFCVAHARPSQAKAEYDAGHRRDDPRLAEAARIRSSARWQRFRDWFRARHPLCCDPFGVHGELSVAVAQVHHVEPLAERPDLACDESNCRPLCTRCHSRVERIERSGESTRALFVAQATEGAR